LDLGILLWLGVLFLVALGALVLKQFIAAATIRSVADEWCAMKGLELIELTVRSHPHHGQRSYSPGELSMRIRRKTTDDIEVWYGTWDLGFFRAKIKDVNPISTLREPGYRQLSTPDPEITNDPEAAIMAEVARRIDQITGQPGWAAAHDLDGSGHIDDEEFRILRERVLAEVRTELAASPQSSDEAW